MAAEVSAVAAEELVSADARQNHLDVLARELRHQESRDERGVRQRLIHVPQQLRQQADDVGANDDFAMLSAEQLGHAARIRQLVVERFCFAAFESDRIRANRLT